MQTEQQRLLEIAFKCDSTVLILGQTGTGKTSIARTIHEKSLRARGRFVAINLATLHEGTLESELFGHERGAFTGADTKRIGKLDLADGGTVFLDEIGELPLRLQARLLDFIQNRSVSPVGGNREKRLDVRVIAATHKNLAQAVTKGEFREDLFHRLRVITIPLKPLRERSEEFNALLEVCMREISNKLGKSAMQVSPKVREVFGRYSWPGNIRELRNVLEFSMLASPNTEITLKDLPVWFHADFQAAQDRGLTDVPILGVAEVPLTLDYLSTLKRFEKEYLRRALSRYGGRINRTARQIGLSKATFLRRLKLYGLNPSLGDASL